MLLSIGFSFVMTSFLRRIPGRGCVRVIKLPALRAEWRDTTCRFIHLNVYLFIFIYLAAVGLSCGLWDLLVVARLSSQSYGFSSSREWM